MSSGMTNRGSEGCTRNRMWSMKKKTFVLMMHKIYMFCHCFWMWIEYAWIRHHIYSSFVHLFIAFLLLPLVSRFVARCLPSKERERENRILTLRVLQHSLASNALRILHGVPTQPSDRQKGSRIERFDCTIFICAERYHKSFKWTVTVDCLRSWNKLNAR